LITVTAGNDASLIAKLPLVREKLLPVQRSLCLQAQKGAIVDGRDIGSVVFPDAHLKIYMTASLETRAQRRLAQLLSKTPEKTFELETIKAEIAGRDEQDAKRGTAPLMVAEGAIIFDTSLMDEKMAVIKLLDLLRDRGLTGNS
jgi:cytidylate kinase